MAGKHFFEHIQKELIDMGILCEICHNEKCNCPERPKTKRGD